MHICSIIPSIIRSVLHRLTGPSTHRHPYELPPDSLCKSQTFRQLFSDNSHLAERI